MTIACYQRWGPDNVLGAGFRSKRGASEIVADGSGRGGGEQERPASSVSVKNERAAEIPVALGDRMGKSGGDQGRLE